MTGYAAALPRACYRSRFLGGRVWEKEELDRMAALVIVINAVLYRLARADIDLAGNPSVYSRPSIHQLVDFLLNSLDRYTIEFGRAYTVLELVCGYVETLAPAGLPEPSAFTISGSASQPEGETWDCPCGLACKALMAEGYEDFICAWGATFAAAILQSYGRHSRYGLRLDTDRICYV